MKRGKRLILLLCVLAVAVGGYFAVTRLTEKESVTETTGSFALTDHGAEELTGLKWAANGTQFDLVRQDGVWTLREDAAFPLDQDAVNALADTLTGMTATRKLEQVEKLADYGLEKPEFTVEADWQNGGSTVYGMGAATPFEDGYYLRLDGEDTVVYTVSQNLKTVFDKRLTALAQTETLPEADTVTRLTVGDRLDVQLENGSWYNAATGEKLESGSVTTLIDAAKALSWKELTDAQADDGRLTELGLGDESALKVTLLNGEETVWQLLIGKETETGNYYARLPGSRMTYVVLSSAVNGLLTADVNQMYRTALTDVTAETLRQIEWRDDGHVWTLNRDVTVQENAGGDGENADGTGTETAVYTVNGTAMEASEAEALLGKMTAMTLSGKPEEAAEGDTLLTAAVTDTDGNVSSLTFMTCDAERYLCVRDGFAYYCDAAAVDQLLRTLRQLR